MMKNLPSHALTVVLTLATAGAGSYVYHQRFAAAPAEPVQTIALNAPAAPVVASLASSADNAQPVPALVVTQNSPGAVPASVASPDTVTHLDPFAPVYAPPPGTVVAMPWYTAYAAPAAAPAPAQTQVIAGLESPLGGVISIPPVVPASVTPALAYAPQNVAYAAPAPASYDNSGAYGGGIAVGSSGRRTTTRQTTTPYLDSAIFTGAPFSLAQIPTNANVVIPPPGTTVGSNGLPTGTTSGQNGTVGRKRCTRGVPPALSGIPPPSPR
jgi:hypothetical protein